MTTKSSEGSKLNVPYVPFRTFLSAIEGFERNMPGQIDSSVWPTYSGAIRSQLLMAFDALGLRDDKGRSSAALKAIVEDKEHRKSLLRPLLETTYPALFALNLAKATPKQLNDVFEEYGKTGETTKKIKSFFLQAAKYSGVPMNPLLLTKTRNVTQRKKKTNLPGAEPSTDNQQRQTNSMTIELESGVRLTLSLSGNVLELNANDRNFVFALTDKLEGYKTRDNYAK